MPARSLFTLFHRWLGLVMAGFLLIVGLTGSLLAWKDELDAAISPQLFHALPPSIEAQPFDPLKLREHVQAMYPGTFIAFAPLVITPQHSQVFYLYALPDPATGNIPELDNNQIFVNPYTGQVQGERKWGDISQGTKNLIPFVYRLHYALALDTFGGYLLGIIALLWTLDCFIAAWLTFPLSLRNKNKSKTTTLTNHKTWLARWWPAWKVRFRGGSYKLNFDLHRAGGLWVWAMLFVLAWSSVAFNLPEIYQPITNAAFAHQPEKLSGQQLSTPLINPPIDWQQARSIGRNHIETLANKQGFMVFEEKSLGYNPDTGLYRYSLRSSHDITEHEGSTTLYIDGRNGKASDLWLPTGAAAGDTITTWISALHRAALWGLPMKLFVCLMGLVITLLCITGVIIWLRKRSARQRSAQRKQTTKTNTLSAAQKTGIANTPQTEFHPSLLKTPTSR